MDYAEIGKRRPRIDAYQQVTGQVEYARTISICPTCSMPSRC